MVFSIHRHLAPRFFAARFPNKAHLQLKKRSHYLTRRGQGGRGPGAAEEEDAPLHEEEEQHAEADKGEDVPTPDVAEAADEDGAADHDPGTNDCFSGV